jgi:hypothetical protein
MKTTLSAIALAVSVIAASGAVNAMPFLDHGFWYEVSINGN